jgi:hypothetical protein
VVLGGLGEPCGESVVQGLLNHPLGRRCRGGEAVGRQTVVVCLFSREVR